MKITKSKVTKKISELVPIAIGIASLSKKTGFIKRKDGKINGEMYVISFFMMLLGSGTTLYNWTLQLCRLADKLTFTEQVPIAIGMERKLTFRHEFFAKSLLVKALKTQLIEESPKRGELALKHNLNHFNRILLQDSTCINVPSNLADFFPSSFVKKGVSATARIQLTMSR